MKKHGNWLILAAALGILLALPLNLLQVTEVTGILVKFGSWLRNLSLSGDKGNLAAWGIVIVITVLPALGLLWRGRSKWDLLLILAAAQIFAGLYFMVNPALLGSDLPIETIWALASVWAVTATLLAWAEVL